MVTIRRDAGLHPHGTMRFAGSWDQGDEARRPTRSLPRIGNGVDQNFDDGLLRFGPGRGVGGVSLNPVASTAPDADATET